jgi:hypothetical protein
MTNVHLVGRETGSQILTDLSDDQGTGSDRGQGDGNA